jgi:hypothetical protein
MYSLTLFKNIYDNDTSKRMDFDTWERLEKLLFTLSTQEGQKGGSNSSPLISPAMYRSASTRANDNVLGWGSWCCVDIDEYDGTIDDVLEHLKPYYYICYSTASSKEYHPKFRVVFPLTGVVGSDKIKAFWHAINALVLDVVDAQTKDLSRMYYVPAKYPDAYNFIFKNEGKHINPFDLMAKYPYVEATRKKNFLQTLPDAIQREVISYRRNQMENMVTWTGYKDCSFFPKKLAQEYSGMAHIDGSGRYQKMYQIMVAIAGNASEAGYPITAEEIVDLCREFDIANTNLYEKRPMLKEAQNALEYAIK